MKIFLLVLLLVPLFGEEEIVVHLPTQKQSLIPITLTWSGPHEKLKRVLAFDFTVNGVTELAAKAAYRIDAKASEEKLVVKAYVASEMRGIFEVPLTGKLGSDRRSIHQLSDAIQKKLFGLEGIASTRLLYTIDRGESQEIWTADYDGGNARRLICQKHLLVTPVFMPAQEGCHAGSFFYVSYDTGQPRIFISSIKGGAPQRLSHLTGQQLLPAVSLSRDRVAFVSDHRGCVDLFLQPFHPEVGAIGKPRLIFTAKGATQGSPTFSPDGQEIAFVSDKGGRGARIYVMKITPKLDLKPRLISKKNRENTSPSWSPDGTKIAYSAMADGVRQIWIFDIKSEKEWQLTSGPTHKENPSWAPDSLHLLFNSATRSSSELYLVNLHRPEAIKITSGGGVKRFPSWEQKARCL